MADLDILAPERSLMAGLGARAATLPTFSTADTDKAIAAAGNKIKPDLQPLMREKIAITDATSQALQIENEGKQALDAAKRKLQSAASQHEAQQYKSLVDNFGEVEKTAPELHPTKENFQSVATMFSLIGLIGTAMGRTSGPNSAMNALASMTGMMKGWQEGNQAKWNREVQEFDKHVTEFKNRLDAAQRKYQMGLQELAYDRKSAEAKMDEALVELGSPLLKAAAARQGYESTFKTLQELSKDARQIAHDAGTDKRTSIEEQRLQLERGEVKPVGVDAKGNVIVMTKDGQERVLEGVKPAGVGRGQFQQLMIAQRTITALRGAASAAESLTELPAKTRVGILPYLGNKEGMLSYVRDSAGRKISSEEAKEMDTLYTGVSRYLAQIESMGAATGLVGLSKQLESLKPQTGDTVKNVALKLADIRRISTESVGALVDSGLLPEQMTNAAIEQLNRMEKAIPFTTEDVVKATTKGKETLGAESTKAVGLSKSEEQRLKELEAKQ